MVEKRPRQRFGSKQLFHKIVEESIKFQANIPLNLLKVDKPSGEDSPTSRSSIQKQVGTTTYLQIFGKEIMRIVSLQILER